MDRIEAELQAIRDKWEDECRKRKEEVLDDPTELFQALQHSGEEDSDRLRAVYRFLGDLTRQGIDLFRPSSIHAANELAEQTIETVKDLSELIESAVEDYIEKDHGE